VAKALLLAWASPASQESSAEFEQWYQHTHIPQVCAAIPSIGPVTRYALVDPEAGGQSRFLAVYEMDDDDIPAASAALGDGVSSGRIQMSESLDRVNAPPQVQWYRQHPVDPAQA